MCIMQMWNCAIVHIVHIVCMCTQREHVLFAAAHSLLYSIQHSLGGNILIVTLIAALVCCLVLFGVPTGREKRWLKWGCTFRRHLLTFVSRLGDWRTGKLVSHTDHLNMVLFQEEECREETSDDGRGSLGKPPWTETDLFYTSRKEGGVRGCQINPMCKRIMLQILSN